MQIFSELHAHACIRNYASNSMSILNTVFEGMAPKYSVDYHDRNSPTCTYMYMHNIHIEHPYDTLFTKALIHAEQSGGIVHLDGVFSQTGRTVQVEAGKSIVKSRIGRTSLADLNSRQMAVDNGSLRII